ncbi:MAG: hypothetical protein ACR2L0_09840, partial [Gaiellaceae bacterium]
GGEGEKKERREEGGRREGRKGEGKEGERGAREDGGGAPLWLLAGASDLLHGSRVYLETLVEELQRARLVSDDLDVSSVDELLEALERGSGRTAGLIDVPPVELEGLRTSLQELRADAASLPAPTEMARLFDALRRTAAAEERPLLEVSAGVGLAFLTSARTISREHVVAPYREDWKPLRREGFAAYARRVSGPYRRAAAGHFDPARVTWTARGGAWLRRRRRAA